MISRQEAERIAAEWAREETRRRGYECTPMLNEFDEGYVVWSRRPESAPPTVPGDGTTTVIDKETGDVSQWPAVPPPMVMDMYRRGRTRRVARPRTVEPAAELRRDTTRGPAPTSVAHLTVGGRVLSGLGAKGDVELRHHPLVAAFVAELPTGRLTRGGDRHAELVVLSDALHAADADRAGTGEPPLTLEQARELLAGATLEVHRITEPDDPASGLAYEPCESCATALVEFGVFGPDRLVGLSEFDPPGLDLVGDLMAERLRGRTVPETDRFPPEVARALVAANWEPDRTDGGAARLAADVLAEFGHESFPAAELTVAAFPMLTSMAARPGEQVRVRYFRTGFIRVRHTAGILREFGARIGSRLFPVGWEARPTAPGVDAILAVDERGRIFALDQAGEWFLGEGVDEALTNLLLGRAVPRLRADGTW
jgi:hypothetical protein